MVGHLRPLYSSLSVGCAQKSKCPAKVCHFRQLDARRGSGARETTDLQRRRRPSSMTAAASHHARMLLVFLAALLGYGAAQVIEGRCDEQGRACAAGATCTHVCDETLPTNAFCFDSSGRSASRDQFLDGGTMVSRPTLRPRQHSYTIVVAQLEWLYSAACLFRLSCRQSTYLTQLHRPLKSEAGGA